MKSYVYDKFRCTGGECSMTCCEGWDIDKSDSEVCMKMIEEKIKSDCLTDKCPLLNENGLCSLIISHGESKLPAACKKFPRVIYKNADDIYNYDLSFACPEVLNIIKNTIDTEKIYDEEYSYELTQELTNIILDDAYPLDVRMMGAWIYIDGYINGNKLYENKTELLDFIGREMVELEPVVSIVEINDLCIDILVNYMEVDSVRDKISSIYDKAISVQNCSDTDLQNISMKWQQFKQIFDDEENMIKIINRVFMMKTVEAIENSDGDLSSILNFQSVIFEFVLIRYCMFLQWLDSNFSEENIILLISVFSRIIGHNIDAFIEFIEDAFAKPLCDNEYIMLILG